jgi:hypothetical protein
VVYDESVDAGEGFESERYYSWSNLWSRVSNGIFEYTAARRKQWY